MIAICEAPGKSNVLQATGSSATVTPDRIAFFVKADRDLVDATLAYLVSRKEAWAKFSRGRTAYVPVHHVARSAPRTPQR